MKHKVHRVAEVLIWFTVVSILVLQGCGGDKSTIKQDDNATVQVVADVPYVIISQDTFDSDNFSLISTARKLDELGYIKLLAVDVTGRDSAGKAGKLFSILLDGTDVPIFINQNQTPTRVTPSSAPYPDIDKYSNDGLIDTQRPDSTLGLAEVLRNLPNGKKAVYVVGGHLNNLADLIAAYPDIVAQKLEAVVISSGWQDRTSGKPEMNLSEGRYQPTGASAATQTVFKYLPKSIKIIMASDPDADYPKVPVSWITDEKLKYLVINGHYYQHDGWFYMGDFEALLYAATGTEWYGNTWAREVKTCIKINSYGAATVGNGECNHYYLDDVNADISKQIFKELL